MVTGAEVQCSFVPQGIVGKASAAREPRGRRVQDAAQDDGHNGMPQGLGRGDGAGGAGVKPGGGGGEEVGHGQRAEEAPGPASGGVNPTG
ncbi:unnamed protein product [Lampetra fluviatilis]